MNRNDTQFAVQKIREQYMEKQTTELEALRALDAKVKRPANIFAYTFGTLSAIVMGAGMSFVMTDIGATLGMTNTMLSGIVTGVIGMAAVIANYPIYKRILSSRRKKYAKDILAASEKMLNN